MAPMDDMSRMAPMDPTDPSASVLIRCTPRGWFSWNFDLDGDGHGASVYSSWMKEQGNIRVDRIDYRARKHGVFSGRWTLERDGQVIAEARKASALSRRIEVQGPMGVLSVRPITFWGRSFQVERGGAMVATIIPEHMLTRRSWIMIDQEDYDWPTVCFVFWLISTMWRRDADAS